MGPTFFIWIWSEYEWAGRTEYRRKIIRKNLKFSEVREFLSRNQKSSDDDTFHVEKSEDITKQEYED